MKILLSVLFLTIISCNQQQQVDTKEEGEKLMQLSRDWSEAASSRNLEETLSYWDNDAVLISPGQPALEGKDAIRGMVEENFSDPSFQISWEPVAVEISESGDLGYLIENTKISMNDTTGNPVTHNFKAVTVWKKNADGSWKNVVDVLSPAPPQGE